MRSGPEGSHVAVDSNETSSSTVAAMLIGVTAGSATVCTVVGTAEGVTVRDLAHTTRRCIRCALSGGGGKNTVMFTSTQLAPLSCVVSITHTHLHLVCTHGMAMDTTLQHVTVSPFEASTSTVTFDLVIHHIWQSYSTWVVVANARDRAVVKEFTSRTVAEVELIGRACDLERVG